MNAHKALLDLLDQCTKTLDLIGELLQFFGGVTQINQPADAFARDGKRSYHCDTARRDGQRIHVANSKVHSLRSKDGSAAVRLGMSAAIRLEMRVAASQYRLDFLLQDARCSVVLKRELKVPMTTSMLVARKKEKTERNVSVGCCTERPPIYTAARLSMQPAQASTPHSSCSRCNLKHRRLQRCSLDSGRKFLHHSGYIRGMPDRSNARVPLAVERSSCR